MLSVRRQRVRQAQKGLETPQGIHKLLQFSKQHDPLLHELHG
jgi:hypothetical protein